MTYFTTEQAVELAKDCGLPNAADHLKWRKKYNKCTVSEKSEIDSIEQLCNAAAKVGAAAERAALKAQLEEVQRDAERLHEALQEAKTGLEWYQVNCPELVDGSDDEAMERIDAAIKEKIGRAHV